MVRMSVAAGRKSKDKVRKSERLDFGKKKMK
jgi:hypothetical protein